MQLQRLHPQVVAVEHPHDLGELRLAARQLDGHGSAAVALGLSEPAQQLRQTLAGLRVHGLDRHARAPDFGLQLGGGALRDDRPAVDDPDPVGQRVRLLEVLRGEEHRDPLVVGQPRDLLPQRRPALGVQAGRGLVEEQDPGLVDQRHGEVQAPLHAARITTHAAIRGFLEPHPLEQRLGALTALGRGNALERRLQVQVLATGEDRVQRSLLEGRTDGRADLRAFVDDVEAADARRPARGREQRRQHQHRGRLAGSVRSQESVDLAGLHGQVDPVHGPWSFAELAHQLVHLDGWGRVAHGRHVSSIVENGKCLSNEV